jgi:hypothetical protein
MQLQQMNKIDVKKAKGETNSMHLLNAAVFYFAVQLQIKLCILTEFIKWSAKGCINAAKRDVKHL